MTKNIDTNTNPAIRRQKITAAALVLSALSVSLTGILVSIPVVFGGYGVNDAVTIMIGIGVLPIAILAIAIVAASALALLALPALLTIRLAAPLVGALRRKRVERASIYKALYTQNYNANNLKGCSRPSAGSKIPHFDPFKTK